MIKSFTDYLSENQRTNPREALLIRASGNTLRFLIFSDAVKVLTRRHDSNPHYSQMADWFSISNSGEFKPIMNDLTEEIAVEKILKVLDGIPKLDIVTREAMEDRKEKLLNCPIFLRWWNSRRVSILKNSKRMGI